MNLEHLSLEFVTNLFEIISKQRKKDPPPPFLKGRGVGPSKNWLTWGATKHFARKGA